MFHWICPECGREIAPTAKECSACDPSAIATEAVPTVSVATEPPSAPKILTAEVVAAPAPAPVIAAEPLLLTAPTAPVALLPPATTTTAEPNLQPRMPHNPRSKSVLAASIPQPLVLPTEPLSAAPASVRLPEADAQFSQPEPSLATELPHAPLRDPQARALAQIQSGAPQIAVEPLLTQWEAQLPKLASPFSGEPPLAAAVHNPTLSPSAIRVAKGDLSLASSDPVEQIGLPGPTLPFELTSLNAAGIAKMLPLGGRLQAQRRSGTFVSIAVASGFLAVAIAGVFYAMPTLARSNAPDTKPVAKAVEPASVPEPAPARVEHRAPAEIEVTGVRFVTDLPDRPPQIHYLVVNHTHGSLSGVVVNVTLRAAANQPPLSQFSFRAPRLGPYESREMISSIERLNRPLDAPDWRDVQAEIEYQQ